MKILLKEFQNINCFEKAIEFFKENNIAKCFENGNKNPNIDINQSLELIYKLLNSNENSAVQAAIYQEVIGDAMLHYHSGTGCPYYDNDNNYLGREVYHYVSFLPYYPEKKEFAPQCEYIGSYCYDHIIPE